LGVHGVPGDPLALVLRVDLGRHIQVHHRPSSPACYRAQSLRSRLREPTASRTCSAQNPSLPSRSATARKCSTPGDLTLRPLATPPPFTFFLWKAPESPVRPQAVAATVPCRTRTPLR